MTTVSFTISTVVLGKDLSNGINKDPLPSSLAFYDSVGPVSQLSQPTSEQNSYAGLLYTPSLGTRCSEMTATIPRNLSLADIPLPIGLVAFAPSSNCRETYIAQATLDGARAIILYPVSNASSATVPPGSSAYTAVIPVYFALWQDAVPIALAMNQYNTDLRDVPYGQNLSGIYSANDYARLVLKVDRSGSNGHSLPDLWIFLLIVLGLLCLIVATTSVAMVKRSQNLSAIN